MNFSNMHFFKKNIRVYTYSHLALCVKSVTTAKHKTLTKFFIDFLTPCEKKITVLASKNRTQKT